MDFDAHERHIRNLLGFKDKIERLLEGALPGQDGPTPQEMLGDLRKDVTELGEAITGLQQFKDQVGGAIAAFEDAKPALAWLVDNQDALTVLLSLGDKSEEPAAPAEPAPETKPETPPEGGSEAPAPEAGASEQPQPSSEAPAGEATEQPAAPTPAPAAP